MLAIKALTRATAGATRGSAAAGARLASTSTLGASLAAAVGRLPHKEALRSVKQDVRYSFQELQAVVDELAHGLVDLQFAQGDVLAVWLPNSAENVITQLAAAKAGLTLAVIEPEVATAEELAFVLADSQASGLLFEPKMAGRNQTAVVQQLLPELATYRGSVNGFRPKQFRHLHCVISTSLDPVEGVLLWNEMGVNSPEPLEMAARAQTITDKTPFAVSYSKVAGGNPKKSAVVTHGELLQRAAALAKSLKLTATDKVLLTGEQGKLSVAPLAAIEQSAQLVLPAAEFSAQAVAHALQVEQCNVVGSADAFQRV